jgi:hypothetical protein
MPDYKSQITEGEREFAINHLSRTGSRFIEVVRSVPQDLWNHRPGKGQWTVAECAEHIQLTEAYFFMPTLDTILAEAPDASRQEQASGKDEFCIRFMENRSEKISGQPWEEAADKQIDRDALLSSFMEHRQRNIDWLRNTDAPLRLHYTFFPVVETLDAYQFILMMSA